LHIHVFEFLRLGAIRPDMLAILFGGCPCFANLFNNRFDCAEFFAIGATSHRCGSLPATIGANIFCACFGHGKKPFSLSASQPSAKTNIDIFIGSGRHVCHP
jgi:hypothetical protein